MSDFLAELRADLIEFNEKHWPRSQQTSLGASDTYGCRARGLLKLLGVSPSEEKMSWPANVGNSIDEWVGRARVTVKPNRLAQVKVVYRGVPCTVDEYDPDTETLTDWKTKDDAKAVGDVRKYGPTESQRGQVQMGAAGLIEAGHKVTRVRLCFMPREGDLEDGYSWEAPFSREEADQAAEWHAEQVVRAEQWKARLGSSPEPADLEPLRDKPRWWCSEYCEHLRNCRGLASDPDPVDEETKQLGRDFLIARADADDAENRKRYFRKLLQNVSGPVVVDGQQLSWVGGNPAERDEIDQEELLAAFRMFVGEPPTTHVVYTTSRSLRVTKAKK